MIEDEASGLSSRGTDHFEWQVEPGRQSLERRGVGQPAGGRVPVTAGGKSTGFSLN